MTHNFGTHFTKLRRISEEKSHKNHCMSYHLLTRISTGMSHHIKYFISYPRVCWCVVFAFFSCSQHPNWNSGYSFFHRRMCFVGEIFGLADGKWNKIDVWTENSCQYLRFCFLSSWNFTQTPKLLVILRSLYVYVCVEMNANTVHYNVTGCVMLFIASLSSFSGYIDDDVMLG